MAEKLHLFLLTLSCSQRYRIFTHDPKKLKKKHTPEMVSYLKAMALRAYF